MLAWRKAHVSNFEEHGQLADGKLTVFWERVPLAAAEECKDWLQANRQNPTDVAADFKTYDGTWSFTKSFHGRGKGGVVDLFAEFDRTNASTGAVDTALWANARVVAGADQTPGDTHLRVRFTDVDKASLYTLMAAVRGQSYTNPSINGDTYTGTYRAISSQPSLNEDTGKGDLLVILWNKSFTLSSFRNYGLPSQEDVVYIWNVAKDEAQTIINGYMSDGYTVTVGHQVESDVPGTVDLVVSVPSDVSMVPIDYIVGTNCDISTVTQTRLGLTKEELQAFIATFTAQTPGVTKQLSISFNENTGKYNATATTATRDTTGVALDLTIGADEDTVLALTYRYNLTKGSVETYAAGFAAQEQGKQKSLSVSRRADCTYDVVAQVRTTQPIGEALTTIVGRSKDTLETTVYEWGIDKAAVEVFVAGYAAQEQLVNKSVSVSRRADYYFDVVGRTLVKTESQIPISFTIGATEQSVQNSDYIWNMTASALQVELDNRSTKEGGKQKSARISRNRTSSGEEDGTYDAVFNEIVTDNTTVTAAYGTGAESEENVYSFSCTSAEKDAIIAALTDTDLEGNLSVSVGRNQDDTYNISTRRTQQKPSHTSFAWSLGNEQYQIDFWFGQLRATAFAEIEALPQGPEYSISLRRNGDGTYDLTIRRSESAGDQAFFTISNDGTLTEYQHYFGITLAEVTTAIEALSQGGISDRAYSLSSRGDGKYNLRIIESTTKEVDYDAITGIGESVSQRTYWEVGKTIAQIPVIAQETGVAKSLRVDRDSRGQVSLQRQETTIIPWTSSTFIIESQKERTVQGTIYAGHTTIPTITTTYGSVSSQFDAGTATYSGIIREVIFTAESGDEDHWDNFTSSAWIVTTQRFYGHLAGKKYFIDAPIWYKVKQTRSRSSAENFINYGPGGTITLPKHPATQPGAGSDVKIIGGNKYRATYIHGLYDGHTSLEKAMVAGAAWIFDTWTQVG